MITAPQTAAPPQTNGSARPPTTMTRSGTRSATVASTRPIGPNVVSVFAQRVVRIMRWTPAGGTTGPAQVAGGAGRAAAAGAGAAGAKHCPHQTAPATSVAPQAEQRFTPG